MPKEYSVLTHPNEPTKSVPVGFSWLAWLFCDLWILFHGFVGKFAFFQLLRAILFMAFVISLKISWLGVCVTSLLQLIPSIAMGRYFNAWSLDRLIDKKGYKLQGVFEARSHEEAMEKFIVHAKQDNNNQPHTGETTDALSNFDPASLVLKFIRAIGITVVLFVSAFIWATARQMLKN